MHERFVGSLTTAGVGDGPTETCMQLYWSNISGVVGPPAQKKNQFSPKNGQQLPTFCRKTARTVCEIIDDRRRRKGPTETCLQLYRSNISGVAGPSAQKKNSFRPKMAKNCQFFAENSVFLAGVVSFRAPYPILRVPNPVKCVWNCIGATYWVLQGHQHRKKTVLVQKWPKIANFWPKTVYFWRTIG